MNFIFICGSQEPGKDGVGDYSRRLAGALVQLGHKAALVALAEPEVPISQISEQAENGVRLPVLRFYKGQSRAEKRPVLQAFIDEHKPDILSLQYVPYAFHPKGLALGLVKLLNDLKVEGNWHTMFHELWVGIEQGAPLKNRIYGLLQKAIIKKTVHQLRPGLITTQSLLYQSLLQQMGETAYVLPLFSNIPVTAKAPGPKPAGNLIFMVFGGIHYGAKVEGFVNWVSGLEDHQVKPEVHFVGSNGGELAHFKAILDQAGINYTVYGRQDAAAVSRLMHRAHIGITTTPYLLCEKSGSVAAMLDHDLPVLCIARDWQVPKRNMPQVTAQPVCLWHKDLELASVLNAAAPGNSAAAVAKQFITLLAT